MGNNKRKKISVVEKFKNLKKVEKAVILALAISTVIGVTAGSVNLAKYNEARQKGVKACVEDPGDLENVERIINQKKSPIEIFMQNPETQESDSTQEGEQSEK